MKDLEDRLETAGKAVQTAAASTTAPQVASIYTRRRHRLAAKAAALTFGVLALGYGITTTSALDNHSDSTSLATANSPFTGQELGVVQESPLVLRGQLGPAPMQTPAGIDLTFRPVRELSEAQIEALREVIDTESYRDPVVIAAGEVRAFETTVLLIHDVDPETRTSRSSLVAIGPDNPVVVSHQWPTRSDAWALSGSRGLDGNGHIATGVAQSISYVQLDIDGSISWQRPSDGFVWIPYTTEPDQPVTVTGHDHTGRVLFTHTIEAAHNELAQPLEEAQRSLNTINSQIIALEAVAAPFGPESDKQELQALGEQRNALLDLIDILEAALDPDHTGGEPQTENTAQAPKGSSGFCIAAAYLEGEQPEAYIGSTEHVTIITALAAVAPEAIQRQAETYRDFLKQGGIQPANPESNLVLNWPDNVQAAVAELTDFISANC